MSDIIIFVIIAAIILVAGTILECKTLRWIKKADKEKEHNEAILKALQLVMKNEMLSIFQEADMKHYTNESQRNKFYSTHALYRALGANGVVDGIVKKFDALPTEAEIMIYNPELFEKAMRQEGRWLQADYHFSPRSEPDKYSVPFRRNSSYEDNDDEPRK